MTLASHKMTGKIEQAKERTPNCKASPAGLLAALFLSVVAMPQSARAEEQDIPKTTAEWLHPDGSTR